MDEPNWHEEPIAKSHPRDLFDCGDETLNEFLKRHARQSHEKGGAKTFLAIENSAPKLILGFYSLSPASIEFSKSPEIVTKGLARHDLPVFRLARLAVDLRMQGKGLGGQLLLAAGRRCLRAAQEVGGVAMLIDAKNESVKNWYQSYGAMPLRDSELSLLLPLSTIQKALEETGKL